MAATISQYNHTAFLIASGALTYTTLKVKLLSASASFVATHTLLTQVDNSGAYEISGNGWTAGGETIANGAVTQVGNDARIDGDNISVTATGGIIGPAYAAVIYDDSVTSPADAPLWFIAFGEAAQASEGFPFIVQFDSNGIHQIQVT